jgi:putative chitinase
MSIFNYIKPLITGDILKKICPTLSIEKANTLATIACVTCPKYKIDIPGILHEFIAQVAHESGEFSIKTENMYYSTPERIVEIWPSRFNLTGTGGKLNAKDYIRNPQKLANSVYANRMGNGDAASGDGFRYRGAGFLQLTGFESFKKYADYIKKNVADTADLVRNTDEYALDSACWEFAIDKSLNDEAERDEFITITKRINGGLTNLPDRQKYYERAKKYIV